MSQEIGTPLGMGSYGLHSSWRSWSSGPNLFLMDATQPKDLIDYWNLRALGWQILPVPMQWADLLIDQCKAFIRENHIPFRGNPAIKQWTTLLKSRSLSEENVEAFGRKIRPPGDHSLSIQHWYPRVWTEWGRKHDHVERCDIYCEEKDIETRSDGGRIRFRSLSPPFAGCILTKGEAAWANVVAIRDNSVGSEIAQVLPPDLGGLDRLLETYGHNATTANSEGIVVLSQYSDWTNRWRIPDGFSLFRLWLESRGLKAELSGSGRVAMQLIRSLGGLWGAHALGNADILKLFDKMSHGLVELPLKESKSSGKPPDRGRIVNRQVLWGKVLKANKGNVYRAEGHLSSLLDRRILRLGLQLQCPQCGQRNWYGLAEIADSLRCERCLQEFAFPSSNPPKEAWAYRTQGPFSVGNFAQGSYTVSLALRFLAIGLHAQATWVPGIDIKDRRGRENEIDFAVWWRGSSIRRERSVIVIRRV